MKHRKSVKNKRRDLGLDLMMRNGTKPAGQYAAVSKDSNSAFGRPMIKKTIGLVTRDKLA